MFGINSFLQNPKMRELKKSTLNLLLAALFTAIISVCSQIAIPLPSDIAFTLQTFAVALCGYTLGFKWGIASVLSYIALGVAGLPVFTLFRGGVHLLFSSTGGFIIGFVPLVIACGLASLKSKGLNISIGLLGLIICHALGVTVFSFVFKTGFIPSFAAASLPYILKDIACVVAAFYFSSIIKRKIIKIYLN